MEIRGDFTISDATLSEQEAEQLKSIGFECLKQMQAHVGTLGGEKEVAKCALTASLDYSKTSIPPGDRGEEEWKHCLIKAGLPDQVICESFRLLVAREKKLFELVVKVYGCEINRVSGIRLTLEELEIHDFPINSLTYVYGETNTWVLGWTSPMGGSLIGAYPGYEVTSVTHIPGK